jgi:beta-lactam-binding protein with PASTA domain/predicted Ser/Thr protein kinase
MADVGLGSVVDGRYRLVSRLGSGGMADVYLAEDEQLGRKIALKLLHRRFSEDPGFVERFRREARSAAGLQHPNIVGVYDRGAYDGTYYIAMEYVPGRSLKQLIRDEAPLDPVRAIDISIQILKAARFAHRHGVIHRDLKPHNVIVDDSGHVKVTDFGIARAGASDMTETGSIMGTAQYLSPEQAQGHAVSASSDLYAVAVVLYEMLTGHVPFDADAAVTIALKHVSEAPASPTLLNPEIPAVLEQVVMWGLNKNPSDRPRDADEFIRALESARASILAGEGERTSSMAAVAVPVGGGPPPPPPPAVIAAAPVPLSLDPVVPAMPPPPPPPERRRRNPWPWVALLLALLLAGGGVAAYLLTRQSRVVVPNVVGEQLGTASTVLQNAGFTVGVLNLTSSQPSGTVIREDPPGATEAKNGSKVTLSVSSGPGTSVIPGVLGDPLAQAKSTITAAHLAIGRVTRQPSTLYTAGQVISTDPPAGATLPVGTKVDVFVSSGSPKVVVPDVMTDTQGQAKAALTSAGFSVNVTPQTSSTATAGTVISQSPAGGSQQAQGSTVTIVVAKAPTTTKVPNVHGQPAASATSALQQAGFKVAQQPKNVTDPSQNGIVLIEDPHHGTTAKKGSTVTITVGQYVASTTTPTTSTPTTSTPTTPTTPAS